MEKKYNLVISEKATEEIEEIHRFNEEKKSGLGFRHLEDILDCIDRIQQTPRSFQFHQTAAQLIRRGLSHRFSVVILYKVLEVSEMIEILTVADSRSDWFQ